MTLGEALSRRNNALNFIRLLLAAGVIVGHSYVLTRTTPPTPWLHPVLASWCVNGFFAISGYLIAGSRLRLSMRDFFDRRARRLLPGFWAVLLVVAFVFAPLIAVITGEPWSPLSSARYVIGNAALAITQPEIVTTLANGDSFTHEWNASLWTLAYEAGCYVVFGLLLSIGLARRHGVIMLTAILVALMALHPVVSPSTQGVLDSVVRFGSFFAAGVLCWFLRDHIPVSWWVPVGCVGVIGVLSVVSDGRWYGQLPAAVALLTLAALLPIRIGVVNDVSYGVYIYGWPIQHSLVALGAGGIGVYAFMSLSLVLVLPFAWASWVLVERRWLPVRRTRVDAEDADLVRP